jgi:hypothetical protein
MASPYEIDLEREKIVVAEAKERARVADELYRFFQKHRDIKPIDANMSILKSYFGDRTHDLTSATLELAIQNPEVSRQLAKYDSDEDLRYTLTRKIRDLLTGSPQSIEHTINSLHYQNTAALQTKLDELKRRQVARAQTPAELRAQLQDTNTGVPVLPAEYTKSVIIKMEPAALRKLTQVYSLSAVNARIQGRT